MNDEVTIPDHFPDSDEEKQKVANKRREKYSLLRDIQAKENNEAIARRFEKDSEKQE